MFLKTRIQKHQVGLRFRYGDFERVLRPGLYRTVDVNHQGISPTLSPG